MNTALKAIIAKAKILYNTGRYSKWTDAIKAASGKRTAIKKAVARKKATVKKRSVKKASVSGVKKKAAVRAVIYSMNQPLINKIYTVKYSAIGSKRRLKSEIVAHSYQAALHIANRNYKESGYERIEVSKTGKRLS
jgi:hypothetical protein